MTDPQRSPGTTPRRAEPLQPDRPGRGLDTQRSEEPAHAKDAGKALAEQERTAHENTREGYGG